MHKVHDALAFPRGFDDVKIRSALDECGVALRPLVAPIPVRAEIAKFLREVMVDLKTESSDDE